MKLSKVTTLYDAAEDRFRLLASAEENSAVELWITQRLLGRVVRVLLGWLEQQQPASTSSRPDDPQVKSSEQSFAQQEANSVKENPQPVEKKKGDAHSYLLREIDIRKGDDQVALVFKLPDEQMAELLFDSVQLRQWLSIIMTQWSTAEWPMDSWPQWMQQAEVSHDSSGNVAFH